MDVKNIEDKRSLNNPILTPENSSNTSINKSTPIDAVLPSLNKKPLFPVPSTLSPVPASPITLGINDMPELRVMHQDIELLKKGQSPLKTVVPPKNLPIAELKQKTEIPAPVAEDYFATRVRKEATREVLKEAVTKVEGIHQQFEKEKMSTLLEKPSAPAPAPAAVAVFPQKETSHKIIYIIFGIIAALLAVVGGLVFWWNYLRAPILAPVHFECQEFQCISVEGEGTDKCKVSVDCVPEEPREPISLIPVKKTETIEITVSKTDNLLVSVSQEQLSKFNNSINAVMNRGNEGELRRILVKIANQEKRFADLGEVMTLINSGNIGIPSDLLKSVKDYTLFIYTPAKKDFDLCKTAGLTDLLCSEPRLGLVIDASDLAQVRSQLSDWEETMVKDLSGLIRADISAGPYEFNDSSEPNYSGASFIRYVNLIQPVVSIDYGMRGDLLIVGTSKNSMRKVIDALAAQSSIQ